MPLHRLSILTSLALAIASAPAQDQTARLVKDLNRTTGDFSADIRWVTSFGKRALFAMDTPAHGSEPWITDGTAKGTRLLKDLLPGPTGSRPDSPISFASGTKAAFRAELGASGHEVWVTDGTEAGTVQVFTAPSPDAAVELRVKAGTTGGVFFAKEDTSVTGTTELLFCDGTAAGTWTLNPIDGETQARFSQPFGYATSGPWCYFFANQDEVWRSDGTEAGTTKVLTLTSGLATRLALASGNLFVEIATGYRTQETTLHACPMEGGTLTLLTVPGMTGRTWLEHPLVVGNELYLTRPSTWPMNVEVWATDGTPAGTRKIKLSQAQGFESATPGSLTSWKGAIYLTTRRTDDSETLWRTDGTPAGTTPVTSGTESDLDFSSLTATADYLYFLRHDATGDSIWRTQGDAASTERVKGIPTVPHAPPNQPSLETLLATAGPGLLYTSGDTLPDEALNILPGKKTKGTRLTKPQKGTASAIDFQKGDSSPYQMLGGNILSVVDTGREHELWSIAPDGRRTRALWQLKSPDTFDWRFNFVATTPAGAIFNYSNGKKISDSWVTDGSASGTRRLGERIYDFVQVGDLYYFSTIDYIFNSKSRLWKTDGTPAGTSRIDAAASETRIPAPDPGQLVAFQDHAYFLSTLPDTTTQADKTTLWCTDGTAAGTVPVRDVWFSEGPAPYAFQLSVAGGKLLFYLLRYNGPELWQSDGTSAGCKPVMEGTFLDSVDSPFFDLGDAVIFQAEAQGLGRTRWWRHDAAGTVPMPPAPIMPKLGYADFFHTPQPIVGGKLFYSGAVESEDYELWTTDGTVAGSHLVKDIQPGDKGSSPSSMLTVGDKVYFTADDGVHGLELWRTDGTGEGTVLAADIDPGPYGSEPRGLQVMDGKLYFSAHRRDVGRELFMIDLPKQ
jgi:ELWxxDGT repeat protein